MQKTKIIQVRVSLEDYAKLKYLSRGIGLSEYIRRMMHDESNTKMHSLSEISNSLSKSTAKLESLVNQAQGMV